MGKVSKAYLRKQMKCSLKPQIDIQNHLVESSSKKIEYSFIHLIRKHNIFLFLMYAANFRFFRYVLQFFEETCILLRIPAITLLSKS